MGDFDFGESSLQPYKTGVSAPSAVGSVGRGAGSSSRFLSRSHVAACPVSGLSDHTG